MSIGTRYIAILYITAFGLEDPDDLIKDVSQALDKIPDSVINGGK